MMIRFTFFAAVGLTGCSQQPQGNDQPPPVAVVAQTPQASSPGSFPSVQTAPAFEYSADLGGRAVARAVSPDTPALTPVERFDDGPTRRSLPARILDPDATARAKYVPPPILPTKPVAVRLAPPVERVPPDLGNGAGAVPAKPTLPVAKAVTERSRDVNLPPALPTLGKRLAERVSLDDPTAELGNAAIANPAVKVPLAPVAFLKVGMPDPFELGEQVKPKVAPTAEPGLTPVPVNPRRVK